jgi:hypothetical protein
LNGSLGEQLWIPGKQPPCLAQRVGGSAGAALRMPIGAQEVVLGATGVGVSPDASALFSNSSALAWLERPSVSASWSSPAFGVVGSGAIGAALPLGRFAALGIGMSTVGSGEQAAFDAQRQRTGSFVDRELDFVAGGALTIGPGSVGATVRLLRRDISGYPLSNTGYAVDVGGTLVFAERLRVSGVLANIAGEMVAGESTLRERIPWEARLGATYVHPLEETTESARLDPSGTPITRAARPAAYALATVGLRAAQTDSLPTFALAAEVVPLAAIPVGLRAGATTAGEFSAGFLFRIPVDFTDELRLDYTIRILDDPSDVTHHVGMTVGL